MAQDIEERLNEELARISSVCFAARRGAAIPDLIRTKMNLLPPEIRDIRIVEIVGVDLQADGGTHVRIPARSARYAPQVPRTRAS